MSNGDHHSSGRQRGRGGLSGLSRLVVTGGELRSMVWGLPLALKGAMGNLLKLKPVNNTRADKLDSFMWRYSFQERRCLIPISQLAEAEGDLDGWNGVESGPP